MALHGAKVIQVRLGFRLLVQRGGMGLRDVVVQGRSTEDCSSRAWGWLVVLGHTYLCKCYQRTRYNHLVLGKFDETRACNACLRAALSDTYCVEGGLRTHPNNTSRTKQRQILCSNFSTRSRQPPKTRSLDPEPPRPTFERAKLDLGWGQGFLRL